jgi:hypothetical protein
MPWWRLFWPNQPAVRRCACSRVSAFVQSAQPSRLRRSKACSSLDLTDTRDDRVSARVGNHQSALDGGVQSRAQDPVQRDGTLREPLGHPEQERSSMSRTASRASGLERSGPQ